MALAGFAVVVAIATANLFLGQGVGGHAPLEYDDANLVDWGDAVFCAAMAAAGLLILWYRPRHAVGWLLMATGAVEALCTFGQTYGARAYVFPEEGLPWGLWALKWSAPLWLWAVFLPVTTMLLRYPSGRIEGRWARRVDRAVLVGLVLIYVAYSGGEAPVKDVLVGYETPAMLPAAVQAVCFVVGLPLVVGGALFTLGHTVVRTWRSPAPERQQLAWLVTIAPVGVATLFSPWEGSQKLFWAIPFAVVVGVLRYRLDGIQVVVRRTLLYGSLTGLTLVVFVAVTAGLAALVPSGPAPEVVAASLVAVGLVPARDRLQRVVDRFVYGDSGDPVAALTRLADPVARDEDVLGAVVRTLAASLRSPGVTLVAPGRAAAWGVPGEDPLVAPLVLAGEPVGELRVTPRSGERRVRTEDRALLAAVAPFVAAVVRSVGLAEQLRVEQQRVLAATEAERSRLRRDLHDGLGPSLTGIGLGLEAAQSAAPERAGAILLRLRQEVAASLEEVRRIIDDLHPGALDGADLLTLLRSRAGDLTASTPVRVSVDAPDRLPDLPPEVESAAWRVLEEALTNVVRHSGATSCTVTVRADDGLLLQVVDDGRGYDGPRPGGVGVASMAQRAARLGGTCTVSPAHPGTRVAASFPLAVRV